MESMGKCTWVIPDGFMSDTTGGDYVSHEAVCVLNLGDTAAKIDITVYFEDREPQTGFTAKCAPKRSNHIRLDKIKNAKGESIAHCVPYSLLVQSNVPVVCQHSRMDVSQPNMTLMTTIAY